MQKIARPMISSIPLPVICSQHEIRNHAFHSTMIWAAGEAPAKGIKIGRYINGFLVPEETVLCNGQEEPDWYRASRIFGHTTVEWPWRSGFNGYQPSAVRKPITTTCDCWPNVLRVGRYGRWQKGVLVHHAFQEAQEWLKDK